MRNWIVLLFNVVAVHALSSAAPAQSQLEWVRTYDGLHSPNEYGRAGAVDAAGNLYRTAQAADSVVGADQIRLVKYSSSGVELWSALAAAPGNYDDAYDCQVSPAGDVYICGRAEDTTTTNVHPLLLKYSSAGMFEWRRETGAPTGNGSVGAIAFDAAGNVLTCGGLSIGASGYDALIESRTPAGALNWSRQLDGGSNGTDVALALAVLPSGKIAVAGAATNATGQHFAVWTLDANGVVQWTQLIGPTASTVDDALAVAARGTDKLVAVGKRALSSTTDWLVVQFDVATGVLDWIDDYDGPAHSIDFANAVAVDATGIAWVCGQTYSASTGMDVLTRRYAADGTVLSTATWNNASVNLDDGVISLLLGSAGQAWLCCRTTLVSMPLASDTEILQYDSQGSLDWARRYSPTGMHADRIVDAALAPGNRIAMGGDTLGVASGNYDLLAVQFDLSESPQAYCTAKTTSNGCEPAVSFTGMSSASASSGFFVRGSQVRNQKNGLLFYGINSAALPFQGGTMCVATPQVRTPIQTSNGNASPADDCSGVFSLDMNAYATGSLGGAPLPALQVPGTTIHCQFWGRDPGFTPPLNTMLSNALRYVVLP